MAFPVSPGDLVCDTCPARYPEAGESTKERARVAGWHVYDGLSLAGTKIRKRFCPDCFNRGRLKAPNRNTVMEGQLDLLGGLEDELRGRGDTVPRRGKRGGKGRELA